MPKITVIPLLLLLTLLPTSTHSTRLLQTPCQIVTEQTVIQGCVDQPSCIVTTTRQICQTIIPASGQNSCFSDTQCSAGLLCRNSFCTAPECSTDSQCPSDPATGALKRCLNQFCTAKSCRIDLTCGLGYSCINRQCLPTPATCKTNLDCQIYQYCDPKTLICLNSSVTITVLPQNSYQCTSDQQCPGGYCYTAKTVCLSYQCSSHEDCAGLGTVCDFSTKTCTGNCDFNAQCGTGSFCVAGKCTDSVTSGSGSDSSTSKSGSIFTQCSTDAECAGIPNSVCGVTKICETKTCTSSSECDRFSQCVFYDRVGFCQSVQL